MMDNKNKGKKSLAAVGAAVVAGLTPGFVAASAAGLPNQGANAEITAADVVVIDGNSYGFDELYAKQRGETVDTIEMHIVLEPSNATLYGAVVPSNISRPKVYRSVEQMPRFPGGEAALMKYIRSHINYPAEAAKNNIEGSVVLRFVVNKDGSVGVVEVIRSLDKDLDREAIRVIRSLPKFTPGRQNGQAVSVWYTLPVPFKLK